MLNGLWDGPATRNVARRATTTRPCRTTTPAAAATARTFFGETSLNDLRVRLVLVNVAQEYAPSNTACSGSDVQWGHDHVRGWLVRPTATDPSTRSGATRASTTTARSRAPAEWSMFLATWEDYSDLGPCEFEVDEYWGSGVGWCVPDLDYEIGFAAGGDGVLRDAMYLSRPRGRRLGRGRLLLLPERLQMHERRGGSRGCSWRRRDWHWSSIAARTTISRIARQPRACDGSAATCCVTYPEHGRRRRLYCCGADCVCSRRPKPQPAFWADHLLSVHREASPATARDTRTACSATAPCSTTCGFGGTPGARIVNRPTRSRLRNGSLWYDCLNVGSHVRRRLFQYDSSSYAYSTVHPRPATPQQHPFSSSIAPIRPRSASQNTGRTSNATLSTCCLEH